MEIEPVGSEPIPTLSNRKGWPHKDGKSQKKGDVRTLQKGNIVATQWTDIKPVNLLSSQSQPQMTNVTRHSKSGPVPLAIPKPAESYNKFMGGVDLADQYRSYYPISIINGFLLMKKNVPIAKRDAHARSHIFRLEICRSLLNKSLKRKAGPEVASASAYKTTKPGTHNLLRLPGRKRACYQYAQEKKKTGARRTPETVFEILGSSIYTKRSDNSISLGHSADSDIKSLQQANSISERDILGIRIDFHRFVEAVISKIVDKSPLAFKLARDITCLDPANFKKADAQTKFKDLIQHLSKTRWISNDDVDSVEYSFSQLRDYPLPENLDSRLDQL
ncbi:hypothetical protein RRG08_003064 [Elysia crispata]|uniref:PiggyBac transposable element-derived protein domain-containing protein n=1 Tax=Elysia crispata TaxID=231223 RepID=A0AAE1EB99_9GAST|nr:hypothetical protein RRG08_003064 [Elysia crispata]